MEFHGVPWSNGARNPARAGFGSSRNRAFVGWLIGGACGGGAAFLWAILYMQQAQPM